MTAATITPAKAQKLSLLQHFSNLKDPRQSVKVLYPLDEIVLLLVCATIAGCDDLVEVREWGVEHLEFLGRFLPFRDEIPSHDTLGDVLAAVDPETFKICFASWTAVVQDGDPEVVNIDGKTSRRTHDRGKGHKPLHLVSAWASRQRLVLGQQATAEKSNEITAIPLLIERLVLKGSIVTIDAQPERPWVLLTYASFTEPSSAWLCNGSSLMRLDPQAAAAAPAFVTRQVWYPSKDGTRVSMFLVQQKDRKSPGPVTIDGDLVARSVDLGEGSRYGRGDRR